MIIIKPAIIFFFLNFSEEANKIGGPMNHIPIMPMPIPSFQRNWQTLKSSVLGQNNIVSEKSNKGQLISEWLFDVLNFKKNAKFLMNFSPRIWKNKGPFTLYLCQVVPNYQLGAF